MTPANAILAFVPIAMLLAVTPGLDTALILRTVAAEGSRPAMQAAAGIVSGCLIWGALVAFGLGSLVSASGTAFRVLRWAGAAYLVWLGAVLLVRPRRGIPEQADRPASGGWFWKGVLQNLLNPKVGVFYVSLLPQFLPDRASVAPWTLLLAAIHAAAGLAWFAILILALRPVAALLRRPAVIAAADRLTGCLFIGFGARLALAR